MILKQRGPDDPVFSDPDLASTELQPGIDRRAFMMRSAGVGAAAVIAGCGPASPPGAPQVSAQQAAPPASKVSPDLAVVKKSKGPVMTTLDEFYKVGPGPSVDFDTTVNAMALTAREMNAKYKETSEGGLAVSVVLC